MRITLLCCTSCLAFLCLATLAATADELSGPPVNPFPRPVMQRPLVVEWSFDQNIDGCQALHACRIEGRDGMLCIEANAGDPYLLLPPLAKPIAGPIELTLRVRGDSEGAGQVYWISQQHPQWAGDQFTANEIKFDGQWHEVTFAIDTDDTLTRLRLDPSTGPGWIEVDHITVRRVIRHPLTISAVQVHGREITATVDNLGDQPLVFSAYGKSHRLEPRTHANITANVSGQQPFELLPITVEAENLPPVQRAIVVHHADVQTNWVTLREGDITLQVDPAGHGARIERGGQLIGVIAPLAWNRQTLPSLKLVKHHDHEVTFGGDSIERLSLRLTGSEIAYTLQAADELEGPVVRATGSLEQGLLAGVEYLGHGERSSSTLDIETAEHLRYEPPLRHVTMPLMAFVTDTASMAMTWQDMTNQPVYATPNFFDGTDDHRMAMRGKTIHATIKLDAAYMDQHGIESAIEWAVRKHGLPEVPTPPRSEDEQWKLCMAALDGNLRNEKGWGHCVEDRWPRLPYGAMASTVWRLTGKMPDLPKLLPWGGSHLNDPAAFFITGQTHQWRDHLRQRTANLIREQQPDGSFRYQGKYLKGHFEDTASGHCGLRAAQLLEAAYYTGDRDALAAGLKALKFCKRFRTPRGAQTWELSLHTPDIMASGHLCKAHVLAFRLTGDKAHLTAARRWAMTGIPFIYQWSDRPVMMYATIPVLGATDWRGNWIGLPVQWCGLIYAEAIDLLADHDATFDWRRVARGITVVAEQMQYPDGPHIGCLPDSFALADQTRRPWDINPCATIYMHKRLAGQPVGVYVAADDHHRVVAPFPVTLDAGVARIDPRHVPPGLAYQLLINGEQIINVSADNGPTIPLNSQP